jgi:hypothetical protein
MLAATLLFVLVPDHIGCARRHRFPQYVLANTRFEYACSQDVHPAEAKEFELHLQPTEIPMIMLMSSDLNVIPPDTYRIVPLP